MLPRHTASLPATAGRTPVVRIALLLRVLVLGLTTSVVAEAGPASAALPRRSALANKIDWAILHLLNRERAAHGLRPLSMVPALRRSARRHNVNMSRFNTMSHQLPGEPVFTRRISNAGYDWSWAGENIAWNSDMSLPGVALLARLMYHEKPPNNDHRLNILSTHYRNVGVDVYLDHEHHKVWLTTDFGKRW
jgi:uncharacterized protein YkwD